MRNETNEMEILCTRGGRWPRLVLALVLGGCGSKGDGVGSGGGDTEGAGGSGGPGTTGDTGDTGGPPPADEGRCPGWTAQVLEQACAAAESGEVVEAVYRAGTTAAFEADGTFGAAQVYRLDLSLTNEGGGAFTTEVGLYVDFQGAPSGVDWPGVLAAFAVDSDLQPVGWDTVDFRYATPIDVSSCKALRGGGAMPLDWSPNMGSGDPVSIFFAPDVPPDQMHDAIPWDQAIHVVVVTKVPECLGAEPDPGTPRALPEPTADPAAGEPPCDGGAR